MPAENRQKVLDLLASEQNNGSVDYSTEIGAVTDVGDDEFEAKIEELFDAGHPLTDRARELAGVVPLVRTADEAEG